jgi:hypothetical protein
MVETPRRVANRRVPAAGTCHRLARGAEIALHPQTGRSAGGRQTFDVFRPKPHAHAQQHQRDDKQPVLYLLRNAYLSQSYVIYY